MHAAFHELIYLEATKIHLSRCRTIKHDLVKAKGHLKVVKNLQNMLIGPKMYSLLYTVHAYAF